MIYALAVIANVAALALLLDGLLRGTFEERERIGVIGFTCVSVALWACYFEHRRKHKT